MFIVNLAFSDLCMMTFMGPSVTVNAFISDHWIYGALFCQLYGFFGALFGTVSLLTMVVIGYDRYNVIVKGLSGTRITGCKAFFIILFIWLYVLGGSLPPLFGWGGFALGKKISVWYWKWTPFWWKPVIFRRFINHLLVRLLHLRLE